MGRMKETPEAIVFTAAANLVEALDRGAAATDERELLRGALVDAGFLPAAPKPAPVDPDARALNLVRELGVERTLRAVADAMAEYLEHPACTDPQEREESQEGLDRLRNLIARMFDASPTFTIPGANGKRIRVSVPGREE